MKLAEFLKEFFSGLIEIYRVSFAKTFVNAFSLTLLCFIIAIPLAQYSNLDKTSPLRMLSLLSLFYTRFSYGSTYFYGDEAKTIFVFFVSVFSMRAIAGKLSVKALCYLLAILIASLLLDIALFRSEAQVNDVMTNKNLFSWFNRIIFLFRIYCPLMLFALMIRICTSNRDFYFWQILTLFISLWLVNEMANEVTVFMRVNVFEFVMIPFTGKTTRYVLESVLGVGLMSIYVLGYSYAMTEPFKIPEKNI